MMKKMTQFGTDIFWRSWAILGPLAFMLTITTAFMRLSGSLLPIPVVGLVGIVLVHFWRWRGLLVAGFLLATSCAYAFFMQSPEMLMWNAIFATACICSLIVTRLGFDEYESLVAGRFREAERDHHLLQEQKHLSQVAEKSNAAEIANLQDSINQLNKEIQRSAEVLGVKEHLLGLTRDEVSVVDSDRQRLMKAVIDLQRENSDLQQQVNEYSIQIEETTQQKNVVQELTDYIKTLQKEKQQSIETFETNLAKIVAEKSIETKKYEEKIEILSNSLEQLQSENCTLASSLEQVADIPVLKETIDKLQLENQQLTDDLASGKESRRLQGLYSQLRSQFEEKSKKLDETRRELFVAEEKFAGAQKELDQRDLIVNKTHEEYCKNLLADASAEIEQLERQHQEEINALQELVDSLMLAGSGQTV